MSICIYYIPTNILEYLRRINKPKYLPVANLNAIHVFVTFLVSLFFDSSADPDVVFFFLLFAYLKYRT